jgi:hypothetical protein
MNDLDEDRMREFRKLLDDYLGADARVKRLLPASTQPLGTRITSPVFMTADERKRCLEAIDARHEAHQRLRDFMAEQFGAH